MAFEVESGWVEHSIDEDGHAAFKWLVLPRDGVEHIKQVPSPVIGQWCEDFQRQIRQLSY